MGIVSKLEQHIVKSDAQIKPDVDEPVVSYFDNNQVENRVIHHRNGSEKPH